MSIFRTSGLSAWLFAVGFALLMHPVAIAQQVVQAGYQVDEATINQVDLIVGTSRNIRFDYKISEVLVENPDVLTAAAPSPNEIRLTGMKPGASSLTVKGADGNQQVIVVNVTADVRRLQAALATFFPDCSIKILALNEGVILGGNVAQTDQVEKIIAVAEDYFPNVVNQLQVDGPQLVATKVRVYEVSRTKARNLGIDWGLNLPSFNLSVVPQGSAAGSLNRTMDVFVGAGSEFFAIIEALEEHQVAKLLDEPTLVAQHGQPAKFLSGGKIPLLAAAPLGGTYVQMYDFGTSLEVVPLVHGYGELTLNVNASVSKPAPELDRGGNPGFRWRNVNTAVRMRAGHTLVLAGSFRKDSDAQKSGIPRLMQSLLWGPLFRKVKSESNEIELVFVITPRFISDVDPAMASKVGVGQLTESPSNHELYINGYVEVPICKDDCPTNDRFDDPSTRYAPQIQPAIQEAIQQPSPTLPGGGSNIQLGPIQPQPQVLPTPAFELPVEDQTPDQTDESVNRPAVTPAKPPIISYNFQEGAIRSLQASNDSK